MSGALKGIGKVFKPIAKVAKVVIPIVLAAAAIYFTAGAALGVAGAAGGWGAAAGTVASTVGAQGALGTAITGAITQAGYGAAIGAATSALTGGDPLKGALMGAAGGAVTGGFSGAMGWQTDPMKSLVGGAAKTATGLGSDTITGGEGNATLIGEIGSDTLTTPAALEVAQPQAVAPGWGVQEISQPTAIESAGGGAMPPLAGQTGGAPQASGGGMLSGVGDFLFGSGSGGNKTPGFFNTNAGAGLIAGVGSGLVGAATADSRESAADKRQHALLQNYRDNYGMPSAGAMVSEGQAMEMRQPSYRAAGFAGSGPRVATRVPSGSAPTPLPSFASASAGVPDVSYQWDPNLGQVVRVENGAGLS